MRGALVDTSPTDLFVRLAAQSATGILTLTGHGGTATVTFVHGAVAAAQVPPSGALRGLRLGERLVHAGRLQADDLDRVLADQAAATAPVALGHMLVERDLVAPDVVRVLLQEQALDACTAIVDQQTGQYVFEVDPDPAARVRVALPVDRVLVEVRRRAREADRVRRLVPGPSAVPHPTGGPRGDVRMSPDTVSVLTAVDGRVSVGAIASTLGYAYEEASRIVYRLAVQGLVEFDGNGARVSRPSGPTTAATTSPPAAPSPGVPDRPAPTMHESPSTAAGSSDGEPEPWVGWANGAPDELDAAGTPTPTPGPTSAPSTTPGAPPAPEAVAPAAHADDDTRRALFSELHAVSRAEPDRDDPRPAAPTPAEPDEEVVDDPAPDPAEAAEPPPPSRSLPDLSGDEVSSLLRELHDLNSDEDETPRGGR